MTITTAPPRIARLRGVGLYKWHLLDVVDGSPRFACGQAAANRTRRVYYNCRLDRKRLSISYGQPTCGKCRILCED